MLYIKIDFCDEFKHKSNDTDASCDVPSAVATNRRGLLATAELIEGPNEAA